MSTSTPTKQRTALLMLFSDYEKEFLWVCAMPAAHFVGDLQAIQNRIAGKQAAVVLQTGPCAL